jgi:hypothetical protein
MNLPAIENSRSSSQSFWISLAVDQDDMETTALETAAHMTDFEAMKIADLICDFYYDLG